MADRISLSADADSLTLNTGPDLKITLGESPSQNVGGVNVFTGLLDTPASYTGQGGRFIRVNTAESGLIFADAAGGGTTVARLALDTDTNILTLTDSEGDTVTVDLSHFVDTFTDTNTTIAGLSLNATTGVLTLSDSANDTVEVNLLTLFDNYRVSVLSVAVTTDARRAVYDALEVGDNIKIYNSSNSIDVDRKVLFKSIDTSGSVAVATFTLAQGTAIPTLALPNLVFVYRNSTGSSNIISQYSGDAVATVGAALQHAVSENLPAAGDQVYEDLAKIGGTTNASLALSNANVLTLTDSDGNAVTVDLSSLVVADTDTNTTVSSLALDSSSYVLTLTDSAGDTVTVDLSGLKDTLTDTNTTLSSATLGNDNVLTLTDSAGDTVQVDLSGLSGGAAQISGSYPQSITGALSGTGALNAGATRQINVSAVGGGSYAEYDGTNHANELVIASRGTYRIYADITGTGNDRTGPGLSVAGNNVTMLGWSNAYLRDADTAFAARRFVDFSVADEDTNIVLSVINRSVANSGSFSTQPFTPSAIANLHIIPISGTKGDTGSAGRPFYQYSTTGTGGWTDTYAAGHAYFRIAVGTTKPANDSSDWSGAIRFLGADGNDGNDGTTPSKVTSANVTAVDQTDTAISTSLTSTGTLDNDNYLTVLRAVQIINRVVKSASATLRGIVLLARNQDVDATETDQSRIPTVSLVKRLANRLYLQLAGGTMTGTLTLSGAPTADLHAATKMYVDENSGTDTPILDALPTDLTSYNADDQIIVDQGPDKGIYVLRTETESGFAGTVGPSSVSPDEGYELHLVQNPNNAVQIIEWIRTGAEVFISLHRSLTASPPSHLYVEIAEEDGTPLSNANRTASRVNLPRSVANELSGTYAYFGRIGNAARPHWVGLNDAASAELNIFTDVGYSTALVASLSKAFVKIGDDYGSDLVTLSRNLGVVEQDASQALDIGRRNKELIDELEDHTTKTLTWSEIDSDQVRAGYALSLHTSGTGWRQANFHSEILGFSGGTFFLCIGIPEDADPNLVRIESEDLTDNSNAYYGQTATRGWEEIAAVENAVDGLKYYIWWDTDNDQAQSIAFSGSATYNTIIQVATVAHALSILPDVIDVTGSAQGQVITSDIDNSGNAIWANATGGGTIEAGPLRAVPLTNELSVSGNSGTSNRTASLLTSRRRDWFNESLILVTVVTNTPGTNRAMSGVVPAEEFWATDGVVFQLRGQGGASLELFLTESGGTALTADSDTATQFVITPTLSQSNLRIQFFRLEGAKGDAGEGIPAGGTASQVLAKIDGTDYNTQWVDQTGGGGGTVEVRIYRVIIPESSTASIADFDAINAGDTVRFTGSGGVTDNPRAYEALYLERIGQVALIVLPGTASIAGGDRLRNNANNFIINNRSSAESSASDLDQDSRSGDWHITGVLNFDAAAYGEARRKLERGENLYDNTVTGSGSNARLGNFTINNDDTHYAVSIIPTGTQQSWPPSIVFIRGKDWIEIGGRNNQLSSLGLRFQQGNRTRFVITANANGQIFANIQNNATIIVRIAEMDMGLLPVVGGASAPAVQANQVRFGYLEPDEDFSNILLGHGHELEQRDVIQGSWAIDGLPDDLDEFILYFYQPDGYEDVYQILEGDMPWTQLFEKRTATVAGTDYEFWVMDGANRLDRSYLNRVLEVA